MERHVQHPGAGLELVNLGAGPQHGVEGVPAGPANPVRPFAAYLTAAEVAQVAVLRSRSSMVLTVTPSAGAGWPRRRLALAVSAVSFTPPLVMAVPGAGLVAAPPV